MTSYSTSIVTLVLSCRVSEILELLYAKSRFFDTPPLFRPRSSECSPWSKPIMLGSVESKYPTLTNSEIILEEFQSCDHDSSTSETDSTALCVASHGNKL